MAIFNSFLYVYQRVHLDTFGVEVPEWTIGIPELDSRKNLLKKGHPMASHGKSICFENDDRNLASNHSPWKYLRPCFGHGWGDDFPNPIGPIPSRIVELKNPAPGTSPPEKSILGPFLRINDGPDRWGNFSNIGVMVLYSYNIYIMGI